MSEITVVTEEESFVDTAENAPTGARIPVEVHVRISDPFIAYRRVRDGDSDGFYLKTTGGQAGWGYFGVNPVELASTLGSSPRAFASTACKANFGEVVRLIAY